jgi:hypothetical protein
VLGWCWVLNALLAFAKPEIGMKGISRVSMERSWEFVAAGIFLVALGLFLVWLVVRG